MKNLFMTILWLSITNCDQVNIDGSNKLINNAPDELQIQTPNGGPTTNDELVNENNGLSKMNLRGSVKSTHEKRYRVEDEKEILTDSTLGSDLKCTYDKQGNITEYCYRNKDELVEKREYKYVDKEMYLDVSILISGKKQGKSKRRLNSDYNLIKEQVIIDDEEVDKIENGYDKNGYLIESIIYRKGKLVIKKIFENDETGNPIKQEYYNAKGKLFWIVVKTFDDRGNEIKSIRKTVTTGEEDETINTYDKYNNPLKMNAGSKYEMSFSYQYDDNGNWIRKTQTSYRKVVAITTRTISYYEIAESKVNGR